MHLESLKPAATVEIPLDHPFTKTDEGHPVPLDGVAFILAGPHTAEAREYFLARTDASLESPQEKSSLRMALADQRVAVLALLKGVVGLEHEGAPLTPDTVRALADSPEHPALPLLLEQAFVKYGVIGDFFGARKPASSPTPSTNAPSVSA